MENKSASSDSILRPQRLRYPAIPSMTQDCLLWVSLNDGIFEHDIGLETLNPAPLTVNPEAQSFRKSSALVEPSQNPGDTHIIEPSV